MSTKDDGTSGQDQSYDEAVRYDVAYTVNRPGYAPAMTTVVLMDGATKDDIAKIISFTRGVTEAEINILTTMRLWP